MSYEAIDVAEAVMTLADHPLNAKQVQKVMFYAHAIHLARTGSGLVPYGFQAWRHGPVSPSVYRLQRGDYAPTTLGGAPEHLTGDATESVRLALELYSDRTGADLEALSHGDGPWTLARGPIPADEPSKKPITDDTIRAVLVPTVQRLLDAHKGETMSLEDFEAEFVR